MSRRTPRRERPQRVLASLAAMAVISGIMVLGVPGTASALTPAPQVALSVPPEVMIGAPIDLELTFNNAASVAVGYGPYADLFLPTLGADGAGSAPDDGISFVSATYQGLSITPIEVTLDCSAVQNHPLTGLPIACPVGFDTGDTLVVFEFPFGSFTPDQPDAVVQVRTQLSDLADSGTPLPVLARGGFRYGADPLANPAVDPPIIQDPPSTATVTPTLITIAKDSDAPEDETATGPNYPRQWTVTVDLAPGQTVTDLRVTDLLPENVIYGGVSGISPAGSVTTEPSGPGPHGAGSNEIVVTYPSVTSTATFVIDWWVPELDAAAAPILGPLDGSAAAVANEGSALGNWAPLDPRDPPGVDNAVADPTGPEDTATAKPVATQKSVSILNDVGAAGPTPGDTLAWTISLQVSDYFAFENFELDDLLSDGQSIDGSSVPRIDLDLPDGVVANADLSPWLTADVNGPGSPGGCSATDPGAITIDADLSAAAGALVPASSGDFVGGEVAGGTGATTATIRFRTVIDSNYRCLHSAGAVNSRDPIANSVTVGGAVLDPSTLLPTGGSASDGSGGGVTIVAPGLVKTIYAINGDTADTGPQITAGDIVTYRLVSTLPLTNIVGTKLTDYVPLPTFPIPAGPFGNQTALGPIAPGPFTPTPWSVRLGPTDTFVAATGGTPAVSTDTTNNAIEIAYGDYQVAPGTTSQVADLLINVVATDDPFADGLFLTNQAQLTYDNSNAVNAALDSIVQVELTEPVLEISKGIVASNNPAGVFAPGTTGPAGIIWTPPGTAGTRFAGAPITSAALGATPIDSNISGLDAGDLVTFAVVVQNTGSGLRGAFDVNIADVVPAGFAAPVSGWNVRVTDGNGTMLALDAGSNLFGAGVTLTDDGPNNEGSLAPFSESGGDNLAVVTFDAQLVAGVAMGEAITNTATVGGFSGTEGGPNFVTAPIEDTATLTVAQPSIDKSLMSTSKGEGAPADVVISGVYGGGGNSGATFDNDFVELVNQGDTAQNVTGWSIQYASASGSSWASPGASQLFGTIAPGARYLIAVPTTGTNGTALPSADNTWGAFGSGGLAATSGKLALVSNNTVLPSGSCPVGVALVHAVGYGSQNCAGISVAGGSTASNTTAVQRDPNDCSATFSVSAALPQNSGTAYTPCSGPVVLDPLTPIGATATYRVQITVPEGVTPAVTVNDTLDAGLAFVSLDSISTNSAALRTNVAGGFPQALQDASFGSVGSGPTAPGRRATIDLGTLANSDSNNATAEILTLTYTVSVLNSAGNVAGAGRNNSVAVRSSGSQVGSAASAANVTIVEPNITTAKTADVTEADAGDTITYTVTVSASATGSVSTAHDVVLTDPLPTGVSYVPGSFVHTGGVVPATISSAMSPVTATWPTLAPGQSATFTLAGVVTAAAAGNGPNVLNTATTTYTSLIGPQGPSLSPHNTLALERTGEPGDVGGAANTYARSGSASVAVNASDIAKSLIATSASHTSGSDLAIGETGTYALDVSLPEGNLGTVVLTDLLPAGMSYVPGSATIDLSGFDGSYAGSPAVPTPSVVGTSVVFTFDSVVVDSGPGTSDNTLRVTLDAIVDDVASNVSGTPLSNTGRVVVSGTQFNSTPVVANVVVPALSVTKAFDPGDAAANDTVTVDLTVSNNGTSTAYDAILADIVDSSVFSSVANLTSPAGWSTTTAPSGPDTEVRFTAGPGVGIAVGATVNFSFDATLAPDVTAPGSHLNMAAASGTTLDGPSPDERTVTAMGTDTLDITAVDLVVTKVADVTDAAAGEPINYTITVRNVGGAEATGVMLTDTLGVDVVFTGASGSYTHNSGVTEWAAFDLAAGASTSRSLSVTAADPMPASATITVNSSSATDDGSHGADPNPADNTDTATVILGSVVDLSLTKSDGVTNASPGDTLTYDVVVTNLGSRNADDAVVVDTLDANLDFVSASAGGAYDSGAGTITWSGVDIEGAGAGDTASLTVTVTVADPLPAGAAAVTNTASVSHPDDVDPLNDQDTDTDTIDAVVDLVITKTDDVDSAVPGDTLTYELVVTNTGNRGASGVTVTDTLDPNVAFVSADSGGTYDSGSNSVAWTLGTVEVGDVVTLTVSVTVDDPLPVDAVEIVNRADVSDDGTNGPERNPSDNSATDTDVTGADLSVTKELVGDSLTPGAEATYVIVVTNNGPMSVSEILVDDTLPVALTNPQVSVSEGSIDTDTWLWSDLSLSPGASVELTMTLDVLLDAAGELTNVVEVSVPGVGDRSPDLNTAGVTDPVVPVVDLQVTKALAGTLVRGEVASWVIEVTNRGPSRATGVVVTDTLPAALSFVDADADGWKCSNGDQRIVVCVGDAPFDPGTSASLTIRTSVAASATGLITNGVSVAADESETSTADNIAAAGGELAPPASAPDPGTPDTEPRGRGSSGPLAFTGSGGQRWLYLGIALLELGLLLIIVRRRYSTVLPG